MKRNKTVFSLLVGNYIIFTFVIFLAVTGVFAGSTYFFLEQNKEIKVADLDYYISALEEAEFEKIPTKKLLGKNGHYDVIDKNDKVVYSSNNKEENPLTLRETSLLMNYDESVDIATIYSKKHKKEVIKVEWVPNEYKFSEEEGWKSRDAAIIDEKNNVLFTTGRIDGKSITQKEYKIMTGGEEDGYVLRKCDFKVGENEYTAIMYVAKSKITRISKFITPFSVGITCFIVLYILLLVIFSRWINKKVTSPITLLNKSIVDFKEKKERAPIRYKGLSELENICQSFDELTEYLIHAEKTQHDLENAKRKLIADISHDLKTPITVIQGYSEAIAMGLLNKEQEKEYLEIIHNKSVRLTDLINTLFEYSTFDHNDYKMKLDKVDICEISRKYLAEKYAEIRMYDYDLEIDIPEEATWINGNETQITRVFENIISNSIKYATEGNKIFFSIEKKDNKVYIEIGDNGAGIPDEFAETIFMPFYQANDARGDGSGLGLAVCRRIVELHNGTITVNTQKDESSSIMFTIVLDIEE